MGTVGTGGRDRGVCSRWIMRVMRLEGRCFSGMKYTTGNAITHGICYEGDDDNWKEAGRSRGFISVSMFLCVVEYIRLFAYCYISKGVNQLLDTWGQHCQYNVKNYESQDKWFPEYEAEYHLTVMSTPSH